MNVYLTEVIDCIEDLKIVIERLPSQYYTVLLNKLESNMLTEVIKEGVVEKDQSMFVF